MARTVSSIRPAVDPATLAHACIRKLEERLASGHLTEAERAELELEKESYEELLARVA